MGVRGCRGRCQRRPAEGQQENHQVAEMETSLLSSFHFCRVLFGHRAILTRNVLTPFLSFGEPNAHSPAVYITCVDASAKPLSQRR